MTIDPVTFPAIDISSFPELGHLAPASLLIRSNIDGARLNIDGACLILTNDFRRAYYKYRLALYNVHAGVVCSRAE